MTFFPPDPGQSAQNYSVPAPATPTPNPAYPNPFGVAPAAADPFGAVAPAGFSGPIVVPQNPTDGPPTSIWVSFGALIGAALVHLISAIMLIVWIYDLKGQATGAANGLLDKDPSGVSASEVGGWADNVADSVSMFIAGLFLVTAAIYVVIAFMVLKGRNGARITATVFAGLSIFGLFGGPVAWLIVGLGAVGVVFMWLKPSSAYFDYRKMLRAGGR